MNSPLVKAARSVYDYFCHHNSEAELVDSFRQLYASPSDGPDLATILTELKKQPGFPDFIDRWQLIMSRPGLPSEQQATEFLRQLASSIEDDRRIFQHHNVASHERRAKGSWQDAHTCRPDKKSGWMLHITRKGAGYYNFIRSEVHTEPGDMVLFSPDSYQEYRRSQSCEEWHYNWVQFQNNSQLNDLLNWPELAPGIHFCKVTDPKTRERIEVAVDLLIKQGWSTDPEEIRIRGVCIEFLMRRCYQAIEASGSYQIDTRTRAAMQFIEDHLFSHINIEMIATAASLSPSALTRHFKKEVGATAMQWREEKRITVACQKLINGNRRMIEIAEELGYANQMYFTRCFRRHMKMTPTEFRRKHR
ncbi:helix-turn-helix domain-containing protein [Endozoicomonas sp.]|uniref:helix-turn-helix domain-containing protein n=1 Tax=Endozoicomonas sp. TaxID=1892382 RepID=UPI002888BC13|nr:helix-turn-helix domain-containing protein [Endozoicomonas sp.]